MTNRSFKDKIAKKKASVWGRKKHNEKRIDEKIINKKDSNIVCVVK